MNFDKKTKILKVIGLLIGSVMVYTTGVASTEIKSINVVTESWDKYTNLDGSGLFLDITRTIFEPYGIDIKIDYYPYKRALHLLKHNNADAMFGTYSANKEKKSYNFTPLKPIDIERTVAVFKKSKSNPWQGVNSLRNRSLAWVRGYDYHDNLNLDIKKFAEVNDTQQGLKMLAVGRFDFFLDHFGELNDTINKTNFNKETYQIETVIEENIYMAFTNTDKGKRLAQMFDQGIDKLSNSGKLKALYSKYDIEYPFTNE